jgi:hypothetical protein
MNGNKLTPFKYNEWAKWYHSNCKNVLPHPKMAGRDKNGRINSRTNCQQNRIAFSPMLDISIPKIVVDATS